MKVDAPTLKKDELRVRRRQEHLTTKQRQKFEELSVLAPIELTGNVVQKQNGYRAGRRAQAMKLCDFKGEGRHPMLALRSVMSSFHLTYIEV